MKMASEVLRDKTGECEIGEVYLLMKEEYRISRNIRASWFFGHLNKEIQVKTSEELISSQEELDVVSIIPKDKIGKLPTNVPIRYKLVPSSHVTFLARRYRHVIVLDLSPSMVTVDIQSGRICLVDLFNCLTNCLKGLTKPFIVPGSTLFLSPKNYVTVIAYTPLASLTTQQVLFQGCLLTEDNLETFLEQLQLELEEFENKLVENMIITRNKSSLECPLSQPSIFDNIVDESDPSYVLPIQQELLAVDMASPEACFINMLWCGILALQLLPDNSSAGIICVTDGVTAMPDVADTNHLLTQMRNSTVACSFLQIGRGFHPHCSLGYIPHMEIMQFIATATFGAFLSKFPEINCMNGGEMNLYHRAFLSWNFQRGLDSVKIDYEKGYQHPLVPLSEVGSLSDGINPPSALNKHGLCMIPLIRKKHCDYKLHTSLANVMSVRLREGYTIKDVTLTKNDKQIEVKMALPWKYNGRIEYIASSAWPLIQKRHLTSVEVIMEGSYEFLHDLTCRMKKSASNVIRKKVVMNFWQTLRSLQETDQLLVHLQSFSTNSIYYTVPDGIKKGLPLLYMPPYSENPVLAQTFDTKDSNLEQFARFWKRISLMEPKKWQRWLHTHRIALLLIPDMPLPKHLYLPCSNGRYNNIQSRVAQKELNSLLTEFSTFTLLENHSYIKLTKTDGSSSPTSFYLIRVQSKAPCVVIRLGFLGGTSGHERNMIVNKLRQKLQDLTIPMRRAGYLKAPSTRQKSSALLKLASHAASKTIRMTSDEANITDKRCFILLARPIDIILVLYERMPPDFADLKISIQVTTGSVPVYMDSKGPSKDLNRLACYLHHHRWIWDAQSDNSAPISMEAVANVLSTLTDLRLQEGFHFSYSNSGIISFVTELKMKNKVQQFNRMHPVPTLDDDGDDVFPCLVQYIVFPPHTSTYCTGSGSSHPDSEHVNEQDTTEADGRLQLVTECWVEPQSGTVVDTPTDRSYFRDCSYKDIPQKLFPLDFEVISTLLTYEHLKIMCEEIPSISLMHSSPHPLMEKLRLSESISQVPFSSDVLNLLPRCQQAELLYSTYIEETPEENPDDTHTHHPFSCFPKPNSVLHCLLMASLSAMTNHELTLSDEDSLKFTKMVLARSRDVDSGPSPPFHLGDAEFEVLMRTTGRGQPEAGRLTNPAPNLSNSFSSTAQQDTWHQATVESVSTIPRWICYLKYIDGANDMDKEAKCSSHLVLTFIPASYHDLQKLMTLGVISDQDNEPKVIQRSGGPTMNIVTADTDSNNKDGKVDSESIDYDVLQDDLSDDGGHCQLESKQSLTLPIYVYDCSLSSIRHQLLKHEDYVVFHDVYQDLTFASLEAQTQSFSGMYTPSRSGTSTPRSSHSRHSSGPAGMKHSLSIGQPSNTLGQFCSWLTNKFNKLYVTGIFQSVQRGQYINSHDVQMAMDYVCAESLHDIDITHFLYSVCGHIRKYSEKLSVEQRASDLFAKKIKFADEIKHIEDEINNEEDSSRSNTTCKPSPKPHKPSLSKSSKHSVQIPLSSLAASKPCPTGTKDLHELIQYKFNEVMSNHFKPIPSSPDVWYYYPQELEDMEVDVVFQEAGEEDDTLPPVEEDKQHSRGPSEDVISEHMSVTSYTTGDEGIPIPDNKINSIVDVYQSSLLTKNEKGFFSHSFDEPSVSTESLIGSYKEELSPLFVLLVCSVKLKNNIGNVVRRTLPTCIGHLIDCLESPPDDEIDPADLTVTLDLICLTLPPELDEMVDEQYSVRHRVASMTESSPSTSPRPLDGSYLMDRENISGLDEPDGGGFDNDALRSIPKQQLKAIKFTKDEIKWLLKDEIASAKHHIFPVTVETLDMVAQHVRASFSKKPSCKAADIPLQFVFGPEHSLAMFIEELERMNIPGYELSKVGHFYHLIFDQEHVDTTLHNDAIQNALNNLSEQQPHRLDDIEHSAGVQFPSTTIICTPPSPLKVTVGSADDSIMGSADAPPSSLNDAGCPDNDNSSIKSGSSFQVLSEEQESDIRRGERTNLTKHTLVNDTSFHDGSSYVKEQANRTPDGEGEEVGDLQQTSGSSLDPIERDTNLEECDVTVDGRLMLENERSRSQTSTSDTSTMTPSRSELAMPLSDEDEEATSQHVSTVQDQLSPLGLLDNSHTETPERVSSQSSESDGGSTMTPLVGRKQHSMASVTSSGPPSSQISYNGSLNDNEDEEGYDGDSSDLDVDDSEDFTTDQMRRCLLMPDFWLILRIYSDCVEIFFHARDHMAMNPNSEADLYQRMTKAIRDTCRLVNQRLLLQDLNNTHSCKSILFGECDEDIWQNEDIIHARNNKPSVEDDGDGLDQVKDYLAAAMQFNSGHFACDLMWHIQLPVHTRLQTRHRGGSNSPAMQALVSALSAFAVVNRRNMFVFREASHAVFYLRLFENCTVCTPSRLNASSDSGHQQEPGSRPISRATSIQSMNLMGSTFEEDQSYGQATDTTLHSSTGDYGVDVSSRASIGSLSRTNNTIRLDVHGVGPPGPEIQEGLVELLKNRLDDATLDIISLMLDRNPMCKLTPDDCLFIQPAGRPPTDTIHFTIPSSAMLRLYPLAYYLGQNLRLFLHTPKYSNSKLESHFQDWTVCLGTDQEKGTELPDNEVYLYNSPQRAGTTGKGIACISVGLVDGQGNPVNILSCPRPSAAVHTNPLTCMDLVKLTETKRHHKDEKSKKPGPTALVQFAVWQRGNVDLLQLTSQLETAIKNSLCDIVMEFIILIAPMGVVPPDTIKGFSSPVTTNETGIDVPSKGVQQLYLEGNEEKPKDRNHPSPVNVKRSQSVSSSTAGSNVRRQLSLEQKDDSSSGSQPSTPVKIKAKDPNPGRKTSSSNIPGWQSQELERRQEEALRQFHRDAEDGKLGVIHPYFRDVAFTWLDYEQSLDVPTVQTFTEELSSHFSVESVISELLAKLPTVCGDLTTKVYKQQLNGSYRLWDAPDPKESKSQDQISMNPVSFVKTRARKLLPGRSENYILIGRNVHQWRYSLDSPTPEDLAKVPSLFNPTTHKSYQRLNPLELNNPTSSEKTSEHDSTTSPLANLTGRSQGLHIVPRQRLLLMQFIDKKITLFIYNWAGELVNSLQRMFHSIVMWHNSRSHLLECLVSQKMGLFNHTHFGANNMKDNPFCRSLEEIEFLVKYTVPPQREFSLRMSVTSCRSSRRLHRRLPPFDETFRSVRMRRTMQRSNYCVAKDPVIRQGFQLLELCSITKKDNDLLKKFENLYQTWQNAKRGSQTTQPVIMETLEMLKQSSRLVHYCATPLLFSPTWRQLLPEDASNLQETSGSVPEEAWHMDLRSSFVQQYVQFLQKTGLTPIETKVSSPRQTKQSPINRMRSSGISASQHLQITAAGGIILIELSFQHIYFCVKIFAFESSRVPAGEDINQQLAVSFTDDCDQYKDLIHLHSFAHDFHLRILQSYFHRPEMGFQPRYHVASFLADFVKYYTPRPKFCRNHIHQEWQGFLSHNTPASVLYRYLVDHHPLSMKKLSMARPSSAPTVDGVGQEGEDYAVVGVVPLSASFKDSKGNRCHDELDRSLIICWNQNKSKIQTRPNSPTPSTSDAMSEPGSAARGNLPRDSCEESPNLMNLCFYVIVTSKRELYPIQQGWRKKSVMVNDAGVPPSESTHSYILLKEEVQRAKDKLITIVRQAANNCRRDTLWHQLLQKETADVAYSAASGKKAKKKEGDDLKEANLRLTYPEFKVLLDNVHQVPFSQLDPGLEPLLTNSTTWYDGLLKFLRLKFTVMSRYFSSEDQQVSHLALVNPNHADMMVLLTVDKQADLSELLAIFREEPHCVTSSQQVPATQRQLEIVANAVSYYLWVTIL